MGGLKVLYLDQHGKCVKRSMKFSERTGKAPNEINSGQACAVISVLI